MWPQFCYLQSFVFHSCTIICHNHVFMFQTCKNFCLWKTYFRTFSFWSCKTCFTVIYFSSVYPIIVPEYWQNCHFKRERQSYQVVIWWQFPKRFYWIICLFHLIQSTQLLMLELMRLLWYFGWHINRGIAMFKQCYPLEIKLLWAVQFEMY